MSLTIKNPPPADQTEPEPTERDIQDTKARAQAEVAHIQANTADVTQLTRLKKTLASHVLCLMWLWFTALVISISVYFYAHISFNRDIPQQVILGLLTSTTIVFGLVGFILKGLFGTKE
jgi:hypothetical protein